MSRKSFLVTDELNDYILGNWLRDSDVLRSLREETAGMESAAMQISPDQGQFFTVLLKAIGARRTIEVGVFTGYSSLVTAMALPPDGRVIACDVSEEYTSIARRYWAQAAVSEKIELRLGPALDTLAGLLDEGRQDQFDFAFIDADKSNYRGYYEACLKLVRPGGLIAFDNVLWSGKVADPAVDDDDTRALRELNAFLKSDDRVDLCLVPIGDGVTLALKRFGSCRFCAFR